MTNRRDHVFSDPIIRDNSGFESMKKTYSDFEFGGAEFQNHDFSGVRWTNCNIENGRLDGANFTSAILRLCNLDGVHARSANLTAARLEDSSAVASDFSRASFRGAHLTETSFSRAVLRDAVMDDAEGDGVDFRGADLRGASLRNVRFLLPDFRGADLSGADLTGATLKGADFRGAILEGTRFDAADVSGAKFDSGAGPQPSPPAKDASDEVSDAAAFKTLQDLLSFLPAVSSGSQPSETMNRLHQLIDQTTSSAGYSPEQQQAVREFFSNIAKPGGFDAARVQQIVNALNSDSDEPPEELKAWLEPFMKAMKKDRQS